MITRSTPPDSVILKMCTVFRYIKRHYAMRHVVHMLLWRLRNRIAAKDQQNNSN